MRLYWYTYLKEPNYNMTSNHGSCWILETKSSIGSGKKIGISDLNLIF